MGTGSSKPIITKEKPQFGSVYGTTGKVRPGYYFGTNKIIYKGKQIEVLENETDFQKLKFGYLKSNQRVFYKGNVVPNANPFTFSTVMRSNVGTLSKYQEKNDEFIKLNTVLGMDYVGNKKRIYLLESIIHEE